MIILIQVCKKYLLIYLIFFHLISHVYYFFLLLLGDACRGDADGIRLTMLYISFWLLWGVLFFIASYVTAVNQSKCMTEASEDERYANYNYYLNCYIM